jgi:sugar phosphate isomerase/epimerase
LSWKPPQAFASIGKISETAKHLDEFSEAVGNHGLSFHYHNHNHEFRSIEEGTPYDLLVQRTSNSGLEFDIGWAKLAGADPVSLIERYGDRITYLHFTDIAPGPETTELDTERGVRLGEGIVDLDGCMEAAQAADVEWAIYEHWEPEDPRESIEHASSVFDDLLDR